MEGKQPPHTHTPHFKRVKRLIEIFQRIQYFSTPFYGSFARAYFDVKEWTHSTPFLMEYYCFFQGSHGALLSSFAVILFQMSVSKNFGVRWCINAFSGPWAFHTAHCASSDQQGTFWNVVIQ